MQIFIGADHGGFLLKTKLFMWLRENGYLVDDCGANELNESDDYPDFAFGVAEGVYREKGSRGILICGTGSGMCIAANKVKGVRASIPTSIKEARLTREHNDANILCLSGWDVGFHKATKVVEKFLITQFSGEERHVRRLEKIKNLEHI